MYFTLFFHFDFVLCVSISQGTFFLTQPFVMSCIRHFDISITKSTKTLPLWTFASFSRYLCVFILTFIKISTIRIAKTELTLNYRTIVSFLIIQPYLTFITFFTCNKKVFLRLKIPFVSLAKRKKMAKLKLIFLNSPDLCNSFWDYKCFEKTFLKTLRCKIQKSLYSY